MTELISSLPEENSPRGRPFEKGNPGRPRGARNKTTLMMEAMLDGQAQALLEKAVALALEGKPNMMRFVLGRIMPAAAGRTVSFELPEIKSSADAAAALAAVTSAIAAGEVTPAEGLSIAQIVEATVRAFEATELEARITLLERQIGAVK